MPSCLRVQGLTTVRGCVRGNALALDAFDEVSDRMHFRPRERDPSITLKVVFSA